MATGTSTPYLDAIKNYAPNSQRAPAKKNQDPKELLSKFHPDYAIDSSTRLQVGANKSEPCHPQLATLLQSKSPISNTDIIHATTFVATNETDVLIIGGGGAGCAAALEASRAGANVILATKLRLGDSNTVMAEGGIQAAINPNDSPQAHFDDSYKGGHKLGDTELIKQLALSGPETIHWLIQQGMQFTTDDNGEIRTRRAGGSSADRVVYFQDYTGLELMRTLRESITNTPNIDVQEYSPAIELLSNDQGHCAGAVFMSVDDKKRSIIKAKTVIIATGGLGQLHLNNFSTSNHLGATGDGLVLAYRLGAKLRDLDSFQYHPTGLAYPYSLAGSLISESIRSAGTQLVNAHGQRFIDELAPRDVVAAAIIRECKEGRGITADGGKVGVWLDTPSLEQRSPNILKQQFPKLIRLGEKSGINPTQTPLLIYPTLHYQNGGISINENGETSVKNLYSAGETSGGLHGRNRLMGNALLEIISFGRRAGKHAAQQRHNAINNNVSLQHLAKFNDTLAKTNLPQNITGPLLFPDETGFQFPSAPNINS